MIAIELDVIGRLCPGRFVRCDGAAIATGLTIDSRRVETGDLFVAVGDGAAYVDDAVARGAAATLIPKDVFAALAAIASEVRSRSTARVVGITGSTGKTSTKDILASICRPHASTIAAEASFNNELGVPLTLCRLESDTEVCVVELAMRGLGQIAALAAVARPEIGVVTNVGPAHVELVGSLEGVIAAKSELVDALHAGETAIVPDGFPVAREDIAVVRTGEPNSRVEGDRTLVGFNGREISFSFRPRHQAPNALAALHAAHALGIEADDAVEVEFSHWRGEEHALADGGVLVNDSWNANPVSMRAALEDLADRADGRRTVAVLGGMAELGPGSNAYHREIGELVGATGVGALVAVGDLAHAYVEAAVDVPESVWVETAAEAVDAARALIDPGDCVLVKGSRAFGLEVVAEALARPRV